MSNQAATIEVGYDPIIPGVVYHKYIIYTDTNGDEHVAHGHRKNVGPNDHWEFEVSYGDATWQWGQNGRNSSAEWAERTSNDHRETIATPVGMTTASAWETIKNTMQKVEDNGIYYVIPWQNSNSLVDTALALAGLPLPVNDSHLDENGGHDANFHWTPGSNNILIDPDAPEGTPPEDARQPERIPPGSPIKPPSGNSQNGPVLGSPDAPNPNGGGPCSDDLGTGGDHISGPLGPSLTPPQCPLVIDLDGDGIELTALADSGTQFDLDSNGFAEHTGWVKPDDGLLAMDRNANGLIDDGSELFGGDAGGFTALGTLDTNDDGVIDSSDDDFDKLRVWQDTNGDGVTDEGELQTLADAGIESISLVTTDPGTTIEGHTVGANGTVTLDDGTTRTISDIWFENNPAVTRYLAPADFTYHADMWELPYLRGYGTVADLHVAMTEDADLRASVRALVLASDSESMTDLRARVADIVLEWAGADDTATDARGNHVDARHLVALEALSGQDFTQETQAGGTFAPDPDTQAGLAIETAFDKVVDMMTLRLIAQSPTSAFIIDLGDNPTTADEADVYSHAFAQLGFATFNPISNDLEADKALLLARLAQVNPSDVVATPLFETRAPDDVLLTIRSTGEQLVLSASMGTGATDMGTITFADGSTWNTETTLAEAAEHDTVALGTTGADTIDGDAEANFIDGQEGNDTLRGGAGSDTYAFARGDGSDTIEDIVSASSAEINRLRIEGYAPTELRVARPGVNGDGIKISFEGTTDAIEILDFSQTAIRAIEFDDGTTWEEEELLTQLLHTMKTSGTVTGTRFVDTYEHALGDGSYAITEVSDAHRDKADRLKFTDVNLDDVNFSRVGDNAVITLSNGETVTLVNQTGSDHLTLIEHMEFSDGTELNAEGIRIAVLDGMKSSGSGSVTGTAFVDTYEHALGDGSYAITEVSDAYMDKADRLKFSDVNLGDVSFSRVGDNAVITLSNGETVTIVNQMGSDRFTLIEYIEFSDGTEMSAAEIRTAVHNGMKASGAVVGTAWEDTHTHALGDGSYSITEEEDGTSNPDTLELTDVNPDDITAVQAGDDIVIGFSNGETVTLVNQLGSGDSGMEQITFADATVWDTAALEARSLTDSPTAGDDAITGFDTDDTIDGGEGNDTIRAGKGDDTLSGGAGDDTLDGDWGLDTLRGGAGNDMLIGGRHTDTFVFSADDGADTIEDFDDGTDTIEFDIAGLTFADLTITADGEDVLITYDTDDTIRLVATEVNALTAADFAFA